MSGKRLVDVLKGLRNMGQGDPRAWAKELRQRELNGEKLDPAVRQMWRDALNTPGPIFSAPVDSDSDLNEAKNRAARRVAEYKGSQG